MSESRPLPEEIAAPGEARGPEPGRTMLPVPAAGERRLAEVPTVAPALATEGHPDFRAGTAALAAMPDEEFEVRLIAMRRGRERITRIHRELMDPETDY